ncbi:hypothetical protein D1BOALGB6SA_2635 [Olavius sp. associated proteobacterium Delta 1]|nr:hypothetical protein D1BOALGB6SA_2635 [Olavius sp. associated proteobacterium Delta 1]
MLFEKPQLVRCNSILYKQSSLLAVIKIFTKKYPVYPVDPVK